MVEGSVCSCFHPTWKPTSCATVAKVLRTTSWVPMCSLPWAWHKKWTHVTSMGCVHMHRGIPIIEGCDNSSCVWSTMEKDGEDNQKARKASQTIN